MNKREGLGYAPIDGTLPFCDWVNHDLDEDRSKCTCFQI